MFFYHPALWLISGQTWEAHFDVIYYHPAPLAELRTSLGSSFEDQYVTRSPATCNLTHDGTSDQLTSKPLISIPRRGSTSNDEMMIILIFKIDENCGSSNNISILSSKNLHLLLLRFVFILLDIFFFFVQDVSWSSPEKGLSGASRCPLVEAERPT